MSCSRHVLARLHPPKKFLYTTPEKTIPPNTDSQCLLSEFKSGVIIYINQLETLNSHLRQPHKHRLIYIPARYLKVKIATETWALNILNFEPLLDYFNVVDYNLIETDTTKNSKSFKFECKMNLSSNIANFQQQTANIDPYKQVTFIEVTDLKIDALFEASTAAQHDKWLFDGINQLFSNYINSLLISILEPNYPIVFNGETRSLLNKHILTIPHLTTIKVPISFIFKTLSFDTIIATTSFSKLLKLKMKKMPISNYKDFPT